LIKLRKKTPALLGLAACLGVCACFSGCVLVELPMKDGTAETVVGDQVSQSDYWYLNRYEAAVSCLERGELTEAYELFRSIADYRDVPNYLQGFSWRPSVEFFSNQRASDTVSYEYDAYGRVLMKLEASTDGNLFRTVYTYGESGNVIKIVGTDLRGRVEEQVYLYRYDENGNLLWQEHPNGDVLEIIYDENGNPTLRKSWNKVRNESYFLEQMEYDGMGRLSKKIVEASEPYTEAYAYDAVGNLILKTIENRYGKSEFSYKYDGMGNLICERNASSTGSEHICVWTYSADGKLLGSSWRDSSGTSGGSVMEYDERGDRIRESHYGPYSDQVTEYVYDDQHRVIRARSGNMVTDYAYDENGNLIETVETYGGERRWRSIAEGYRLYYDPIRAHEMNPYFDFGGK